MPTSTDIVMQSIIDSDYFYKMLESLTMQTISPEIIANVTNTVILISIVIVGMIPIAFAIRSLLRITITYFKAEK